MSRYEGLFEHLQHRAGTTWRAEFDQIERIIGAPLPNSAFRHPAWWANQSGAGHIQSSAWQKAGWKTTKLDLERRCVTFERQNRAARSNESDDLDRLVAHAAEFAQTHDRDVILRTALRGYIARETARELAALGGTAPGFVEPPRRRDAA